MQILRQLQTEFGTFSEMSYVPGDVDVHSHQETHIWLLLQGDFLEFSNGKYSDCSTGDVTIHPAGVSHKQRITSPCRSLRFELLDSSPVSFAKRLKLPNSSIVLKNDYIHMHCLRSLPGFWAGGKSAELSITSFLYFLLAQAWQVPNESVNRIRVKIESARDYIDFQFRDPISLKQVARKIGFSTAHTSRAFKNAFGITVCKYILQKRVESALKDLAYTDHSISSIAIGNGFCDQAHLSRSIKKSTGATPLVHRNQIRDRANSSPE